MYRGATKYKLIWKGLLEQKTPEMDFEGHLNKGMKMRRAFQADGATYVRS